MELWSQCEEGERAANWESERIANFFLCLRGERSEGFGIEERRRIVSGDNNPGK